VRKAVAEVEGSSEYDADASLISSADGLSFDYGEMSMSEVAFTVRREYKCQQQLPPALQQQLRLNFDRLYDQQLYEDSS
jgi:hypothetical protein